jgi:hypothetical protein
MRWLQRGMLGVAYIIALYAPARANPLEILDSRLPGSALRSELVRAANDPADGLGRLELGYRHTNIYEQHEAGVLSGRLCWRGPYLRLALPVGKWYAEYAATGDEIRLGYRDGDQLDQLSGPRHSYAVTASRCFALGRGEGCLAFTRASDRLSTAGSLPSLVSEIAGFEQGSTATALWQENQTAAELSYTRAGSTLGAVFGAGQLEYQVSATTPSDAVRLQPRASGETRLAYVRLGRPGQPKTALVLGEREYGGTGGIWRGSEWLGPAHDSQHDYYYGISYAPVQAALTNVNLYHVKTTTAFYGSASLAGFQDGVFGLFAARGHLAAESVLNVESLSVQFAPRHRRRIAPGYEVGLSHYSLDAAARTYGTLVFGGVKVQEHSHELRRRGWLAHALVSLDYTLSDAAELRLSVAQSLPFLARDLAEPAAPGPPGPNLANRVNGGRDISLSVVYSF